MSDHNQINRVVQNIINTNNLHIQEAALMDIENQKKTVQNVHNHNDQSVLSTMSSEELNNKNELLDVSSNESNLNSSEEIITFKSKEKNIDYSFANEYFDEVYQNLLLDENKFYIRINNNYLSFQNSINYKMRAILVDWLMDVHYRCGMKSKTLHHCIYIIDIYLSKNVIDKKDFQLLGMAALLIACKESEIIFPPLKTFLAFSSFAYTKQELLKMEKKIMKKLKFDILAPTAEEFFAINSEYFKFTDEQRYFGLYFLDSSLIDYNLLKYKQSTIAVACGYITMKFFKINSVRLLFHNLSKDVNRKEVKNCARELCYLLKTLSNSSFKAAKTKYMDEKFLKVAQLCEGN